MNKYKYKYFMNGMIDGTDGKTYEIEVPCRVPGLKILGTKGKNKSVII